MFPLRYLDNDADFLDNPEYEASLGSLEYDASVENYGYRDVRQSLTLTLPNTGDYDIECLVKQDGYSVDIVDVVPIVVTKTGKTVSNS